jgi:hypothetical protein
LAVRTVAAAVGVAHVFVNVVGVRGRDVKELSGDEVGSVLL